MRFPLLLRSPKQRDSRRVGTCVPRLETLEDRTVPSIVSENALPGTPRSTWDTDHNNDPSIQGYAVGFSVNHGQNITFRIDLPYNTGQTGSIPYTIQIYRFGYYQGNGARLVDNTIPQQQGTPQPAPVIDHSTGLVDAGNWRDSWTWHVPSTATSGLYFARLTRDDGTLGTDNRPASNMIFFVVRDDGGHSDILLKTSDATWEAYNYYGGSSLYFVDRSVFPLPDLPYNRAYQVSYNRPLTNVFNGGEPYGTPLTPTSDVVNNQFFHTEFPFVCWAEANGYNISYVSDLDLARNPNLVMGHKIIIASGHDEYWSQNERNAFENARAAGINLSFQDGNEVYWRTQFYAGIGGSASDPRTLSCYKESYNPNLYDAARGFTGLWDDEVNYGLPNKPTNALTGQDWVGQYNTPAGIDVAYPDSADRFWRNTSIANLRSGQQPAVIQGVIGFEFDESPDNGMQPPGLIQLSHTVYTGTIDYSIHPVPITHTLTLYRDPHSHALVFGAGDILFNWALDNHHDALGYGSTSQELNYVAPVDVRMEQAMVNLYADMGNVQPGSLQHGLVRASQSSDHTAPTSRITSPSNNAQVQAGQTVTIRGSASDSGGKVAGVEVSVDGGTTWHPGSGHTSWTYSWTVPTTAGTVRILSRAVDDSGNIETPRSGISVVIHSTGSAPNGGPPTIPGGSGPMALPPVEGIEGAVNAPPSTPGDGNGPGSGTTPNVNDGSGTLPIDPATIRSLLAASDGLPDQAPVVTVTGDESSGDPATDSRSTAAPSNPPTVSPSTLDAQPLSLGGAGETASNGNPTAFPDTRSD
jgi:hypothetical protein